MATRYTSTIEVCCWKEHTCVGCGGTYSYLFTRKVTGTAGTAEKASEAARAAALKTTLREVDMQPCPTCGLYQPDMLAAGRARRHKWIFGLAAVALAVMVFLHLTDLVRDDWLVWIATGGLALAGIAGYLTDFGNPNSDLEANRELAQSRVAKGVVRQGAAGQAPIMGEAAWTPRPTVGYAVALLLAAVGLAVTGLPEVMREAGGWTFNAGWHPPVAGPGDTTYLWLPQTVSCIKSLWRGTAEVTAREVGGAGAEFPIQASTKSETWGDTIHAKSSEKSSNPRLWVRLHVPEKADLADKTLDCRIQLHVICPRLQGERFSEVSEDFAHTARLQLSAPHSGSRYNGAWWGGILGGSALLLVSQFVRLRVARGLQAQAKPAIVRAPDDVNVQGA